MDAEGTLQKFALRARRIAAHSLAADRERLAEMANPRMAINLNLNGQIELRRELPDEEVFESMAARLRPILVNSESVHHRKVLTALETVLEQAAQDTDDLAAIRAEVQRLRVAWSRYDESTLSHHRYTVQQVKINDPDHTLQVSDSQLALAWLYGDLVHVDVKGEKVDGTLLPIRQRYTAAVSYFSGVALLCAETFDVIADLAHRGLLTLDSDVMDTPVVVNSNELVQTGVAYIAPVGTAMPKLANPMESAPEGFNQFTVTEWLRMDPKNRVQVRLEAEDGALVAEYDAAVRDRQTEGERLVWRALVAGCVICEVTFDVDGEQIKPSDFQVRLAKPTTNRMALDEARFERNVYRSSLMRFIVSGQELISLAPSNPSEDDLHANDIRIDSLGDLVAIEDLTGQTIPLVNGTISNWERLELRKIRLLWEGHVVPFVRGPLPTEAATGTVPRCLVVPAGTRTFAGAEYPSPGYLVRHPRMVAENVEPMPESEPPQDSMQMIVPDDEPFVAWVPDRAKAEFNTDLLHPTPWGLSHFDIRPVLGNQWTEGQGLTI